MRDKEWMCSIWNENVDSIVSLVGEALRTARVDAPASYSTSFGRSQRWLENTVLVWKPLDNYKTHFPLSKALVSADAVSHLPFTVSLSSFRFPSPDKAVRPLGSFQCQRSWDGPDTKIGA